MKHLISLSLLFIGGALVSQAQSLQEAIRLNENEQQDQATVMYEKLIASQPANGTLYYYYGENFLDSEMPEKAEAAFNAGRSKDPANALNLVGLAELKLLDGDLAGGKALIDEATKLAGPKNALVYLEAGEAYLKYRKAQDLMSSQTLIEQAIKLEPKNPEGYSLLGDVYSELNNGSKAAENYNKSLELDKKHIKSVLHKGQLYKRSTNYEGAIAEFDSCLRMDPNFAPAYREKAETYFAMKKIDNAVENYRLYLEISKFNTRARLRGAAFLLEAERFKEAQDELNKITKADSSNLYMMRIIGYVATENEQIDTAMRALGKVFELTANDTAKRISRDYAYYGKALVKSGKDSLGMEYLWRAIEMDPRFSEHYDDLGKIATKLKRHHISVNAYRRKIANHHKIGSADYYNLGKALYQNKEFSSADSAFRKVTELNPNWPNGYLYLGRTNSQLDSSFVSFSAIEPYQKYIELIGTDAANITKYSKDLIEANSYIAVAFLRKKDCKASIEYWNRVLAIDPKVEQALNAIKIIGDSKDCK